MAGTLSPLEFAAASAGLKLEPKALDAARRVLVEGVSQTEVALAAEANKQTVHYWVKRVADVRALQVAAMAAVVPNGWTVEILAAPADRMARIVASAEAEMNLYVAGERQ